MQALGVSRWSMAMSSLSPAGGSQVHTMVIRGTGGETAVPMDCPCAVDWARGFKRRGIPGSTPRSQLGPSTLGRLGRRPEVSGKHTCATLGDGLEALLRVYSHSRSSPMAKGAALNSK